MAQSLNFRKKIRLTCENDELEAKLREFLDAEGYHVVAELEAGVQPGPTALDHIHVHIKATERSALIPDPESDFETESEFSKE